MAQQFHFAILRIEVIRASRGLSAIAELLVLLSIYPSIYPFFATPTGHILKAILTFNVGEIVLFNKFFPIVDTCLSCEDIARQIVRWCADGDFLRPVFPASRVQYVHFRHAF